MNKSVHTSNNQLQGGYVALMATIIIGAILLIATVDLSMLGAAARFSILDSEAKNQSHSIAEGCAEQATAQLLINPLYRGGTTTTLETGTCYVFPFDIDVPTPGSVTFKIQAQVRKSVTNLVAVRNYNNIYLEPIPKPMAELSPASASIESISNLEVPTLP